MAKNRSLAEHCSHCGQWMFVIPNPGIEMLESSEGFEIIKDALLRMKGEFDPTTMEMAFCEDCGVSAIISPTMTFEVSVVGDS